MNIPIFQSMNKQIFLQEYIFLTGAFVLCKFANKFMKLGLISEKWVLFQVHWGLWAAECDLTCNPLNTEVIAGSCLYCLFIKHSINRFSPMHYCKKYIKKPISNFPMFGYLISGRPALRCSYIRKVISNSSFNKFQGLHSFSLHMQNNLWS